MKQTLSEFRYLAVKLTNLYGMVTAMLLTLALVSFCWYSFPLDGNIQEAVTR